MAKFQDIRALAKQQLQAVTKNGECWKAFLHTAAIAYNYNFPNQLLIYCQNPTATAVADMEYWNKEAGRQVKRGAHGIPILDVKKEMMALRYLFDISDTIPQARTDKGLPWAVTDQNWKPVWDKIIRDNQADSIQNALLMLSTSYVAALIEQGQLPVPIRTTAPSRTQTGCTPPRPRMGLPSTAILPNTPKWSAAH